MHAYFHEFSQWLHIHPQWAAILTLIVSFLECIPVLGTVIPGSVIMTAIGVLIGSGIISFWLVVICCVIGAICGDSLGYSLGYYYKQSIKKRWPFNKHPEWLTRSQKFITSHGGKSIFMGRFVGPVRAFIPLIVGMLHFPPKKFFPIDIASAVSWAIAYLAPGTLLGMISLSIPPAVATKMIIFVLLILALIWVITWITHAVSKKIYHWFTLRMDALWLQLKKSKRLTYLYQFLSMPERKEHSGQLAMACIGLSMTILFFILWLNVRFNGPLTYWNHAFYHLFLGLHDPLINKIMIIITTFGEKTVIIPVSFTVFIWLIFQKKWRTAWHFLAISLLAAALADVFKFFYFNPRPPCLLNGPQTSSFPSGHVTLSIAIYGFLGYVLSHAWPSLKKVIYGVAMTLCALIALSRLYLCVHWFTDILGGVILAFFCLTFIIISYRHQRIKKFSGIGVIIITSMTLVFSSTIFLYKNYKIEIQNYQLVWPHYILSEQNWWTEAENIDEIPLYRNTRLGYPARILNVQWADSLDNIAATLSQHDWQVLSTDNIGNLLKQLLETDKTKHLATIEQLKQDQPPALVAIKKSTGQKTPALLFLWSANITLSPQNIPLWVGSIYYYRKENYHLFQHHSPSDKTPAIPTLIAFLDKNQYQILSIDADKLPTKLSRDLPRNEFNVFMIKQK